MNSACLWPPSSIPSTPVRYNLADTLGPFLHLLPQRLGHNRALDAATRALISVHSDACKGLPGGTETSKLYSQGLATLRLCLCIPGEAKSMETVCAVLLLTFCSKFGAFDGRHWTSHCNGAVQLLQLCDRGKPCDDFEVKVLQSLRGSVICEVLFNRSTLTSPQKWNDLEALLFRPSSFIPDPENPMTVLGPIPRFIQTAQCISPLDDDGGGDLLCQRIETAYSHRRRSESLLALRKFLPEPDPSLGRTARYACTLANCCILNCMVQKYFDIPHPLRSRRPRRRLPRPIEEMAVFRPLRASFVSFNVYTAWRCTRDGTKRERLEDKMWEFTSDFRPLNQADRTRVLTLLWGLKADVCLRGMGDGWKYEAMVESLGSQAALHASC